MNREPAFPGQMRFDALSGNFNNGMFLRDYFAAQAMVAIMSTAPLDAVNGESCWMFSEGNVCFNHSDGEKMIAKLAYQLADAMLREREKGDSDAE